MVLTPHRDLSGVFPSVSITGGTVSRSSPLHHCSERISGGLPGFNSSRPMVLRVDREVKTSRCEVSHHSHASSSPLPLLHLSVILFCLSYGQMYLFSSSSAFFFRDALPVPRSLSLYLYLYQHIKTNYNSRWTTAASHQFP